MDDLFNVKVGNNYLLGKKLGSGSFGEIFLGTHVLTKEFVAVKLVSARG
jgi:casein kinase 1